MTKFLSKLHIALQVIFIGLVVAVVLEQANPLYQVPNRDSGFFMYAGGQILKGKLLYLDIWDSKGPLIFYINAFALWLGHGSRWGVWGMEFIFLFLAALIGFKLIEKLWGIIPALFGTLVWLFAFNNVARGGNFTEEYSLLFSFIALYLFWLGAQNPHNKIYPFIIGITLALNFLLRANNIGVQLSIIFVTILSGILDKNVQQSLKRLLWISIGALSVLAMVALYFRALGTLDDMFQAAVAYNFFYSRGGTRLDDLAKSFVRGVNLLGYLSLVPTFLGFGILLEKLPERIRSGPTPFRDLSFLFLIGFPVEIVMSGLSGNNFPHYYICWSPYIALLSGLLLGLNERSNKRHLLALAVMILLVSFIKFETLSQYQTAFTKILFDRGSGIELVHPVAKYIRDNTEPTDTVLVWGTQPYINLLARRDSPTGILFYPQLARSPFTDELNARFYQDLVQNEPVFIVDMVNPDNDTIPFIDPILRETQSQRLRRFDPPLNLDQVFDFIHSSYHLETQINGVPIYRLNSTGQ
jgi:hypothetical protein